MAHKITEKEETEFKVITLCVNCSVATNLCHKCFSSTTTEFIINNNKSFRSIQPTKPLLDSNYVDVVKSVDALISVKRQVNRCLECRRKVGLTGFKCRCGDLFCSEHRYSDRHDCSYDYKAVGREAIARENPIVKASKI